MLIVWGTDVVLTFFSPREQLVEKPPIPAKNVRHGKAKSPSSEQGATRARLLRFSRKSKCDVSHRPTALLQQNEPL